MTVHRCPSDEALALDGADAIVPCCGLRMSEVHATDDIVADPTGDDQPAVTCQGDADQPMHITVTDAPGASNLPIGHMLQSMADGQREADAAQEAAELAELYERVKAGAQRLGELARRASAKVNPISLELAELRIRMEILSDAAFGDGSRDQLGYELAVQQRYAQILTVYVGKADEVIAFREAEARKAALLEGVTLRPAIPPDGRP